MEHDSITTGAFASKRLRWGLVVVLVLGLAGVTLAVWLKPTPAYQAAPLVIEAGGLQAGDLVFRRGESLTSRMVLTADPRSAYSHVGILYLGEDGPLVVHAIPGDDFDAPTPLRVEPLASFTEAASAVGVHRLGEADAAVYAEDAARIALSYARDSVLFDVGFSLQSPEAMYCTELVWRAYREAGLDLVDGVFDDLRIPLGEGPYILPSSLLDSPYLTNVLSRTRKPANRHD